MTSIPAGLTGDRTMRFYSRRRTRARVIATMVAAALLASALTSSPSHAEPTPSAQAADYPTFGGYELYNDVTCWTRGQVDTNKKLFPDTWVLGKAKSYAHEHGQCGAFEPPRFKVLFYRLIDGPVGVPLVGTWRVDPFTANGMEYVKTVMGIVPDGTAALLAAEDDDPCGWDAGSPVLRGLTGSGATYAGERYLGPCTAAPGDWVPVTLTVSPDGRTMTETTAQGSLTWIKYNDCGNDVPLHAPEGAVIAAEIYAEPGLSAEDKARFGADPCLLETFVDKGYSEIASGGTGPGYGDTDAFMLDAANNVWDVESAGSNIHLETSQSLTCFRLRTKFPVFLRDVFGQAIPGAKGADIVVKQEVCTARDLRTGLEVLTNGQGAPDGQGIWVWHDPNKPSVTIEDHSVLLGYENAPGGGVVHFELGNHHGRSKARLDVTVGVLETLGGGGGAGPISLNIGGRRQKTADYTWTIDQILAMD